MPLIQIDALPQPAAIDVDAVVRTLNRAIAEAIPCRLDAVWTVWRTVSGPYGRGDDVAYEQRRDTHAPIAHVYLRRSPDETARVVDTIERVLARELSLAADNVFVTVQPVAFVERGG
jgi:hypothetical protein